MRKTILSIAVVLAAFTGSSLMAQTPATTQQSQKTEQTEKRHAKRASAFDGIELTEKQQAEIKALHEGIMAERKKIAEQEQAEKKDMMQERQKDTKEYLAKVKEILTPDQYVKFLENSYLNNTGRPFSMNQGRPGQRPDGQRHGKNGNKGQRPDGPKGSRPATAIQPQ